MNSTKKHLWWKISGENKKLNLYKHPDDVDRNSIADWFRCLEIRRIFKDCLGKYGFLKRIMIYLFHDYWDEKWKCSEDFCFIASVPLDTTFARKVCFKCHRLDYKSDTQVFGWGYIEETGKMGPIKPKIRVCTRCSFSVWTNAKTFDYPQRSPEWFNARKMCHYTASELGTLLGHNGEDSKKQLIEHKAGGPEPKRNHYLMSTGEKMEPEIELAYKNFVKQTSSKPLNLKHIGFAYDRIELNSGWRPDQANGFLVGGSPDAYTDRCIVEYKYSFSKTPATEPPAKYWDQVQCYMWLMNKPFAELVIFNYLEPKKKLGATLTVFRIYRDPDWFEEIKKALIDVDYQIWMRKIDRRKDEEKNFDLKYKKPHFEIDENLKIVKKE